MGTYCRKDEMPSGMFGRLGFKRHRLPRLSLLIPRVTVGVESPVLPPSPTSILVSSEVVAVELALGFCFTLAEVYALLADSAPRSGVAVQSLEVACTSFCRAALRLDSTSTETATVAAAMPMDILFLLMTYLHLRMARMTCWTVVNHSIGKPHRKVVL